MTTSNPFRLAIQNLAEKGWHKGGPRDKITGATCIGVALGDANRQLNILPWEPLSSKILKDVIKEQFPDRISGPYATHWIEFNDHSKTTLSDVILVLEKASVKYDESI